MAHFALLWKARTIEKYRQSYENEKINSIIMSSSDVPDKTLLQRWKHYKHGMQKRLSRTFSKWYPEGSTVSNFFVSLRTDMKLPSILLRSLYGFIGGLLLTYLGFMFFVFQLSVSVMHATVLSSIIGVLLTLGLTFSNRMRCLIFLLVPQLFSRVGRYTLTCYALVLILTGPATNTLKNSEVLSESMACSQEQTKLNVRQINDSIKKPFNSIKDSLKRTVERMNLIVRKLKIALIKTNKLILSIASVIQSGFSWLDHAAAACNDALGTPHQKCLSILKEHCETTNKHINLNDMNPKNVKTFNKNVIRDILDVIGIKNVKRPQEDDDDDGRFMKYRDRTDFVAKDEGINSYKYQKEHKDANRDSNWSPSKEDDVKRLKGEKSNKPWFCHSANVANTVCDSLQSYEKFCVAADFAGDTFLATIRKKLKTFIKRISALIHVQLNIQHTYTFIGNSSSSNQIAAGIVTEIRNRADPIFTWLSWSSCVTSLFLLLIIFRAKHYQHMFETRSRFDNRFITKEFRELDLKRLREGRDTVLPLNTRERAKYVTTTSFRLVASEKLHLNRSAVFMTVATFKLLIHIVADYSLYWVLTTIRHHGKAHSRLHPEMVETGVVISGAGFVARLLQSFIDTMNMQLSFPTPEHSCLPNPYPPDIKRYCQIGFLIFLLWFFALFEPYGLRMRHLIMGHYRPQRAKDRAVWLYNHILRTRASFMKFARRKLHREYKYSSQSKLTLRRCLRSYTPLRWLSSLFRIKPDERHCLLCNISEDTSDHNKELIKCEVPNCPGTYCPCCFSDIGQLCTICLSPSDYGDFSDVSLEKGSSDEGSSDDNNYPEDNNHSGSYKRKSDNDSYNFENAKANDSAYSKRSIFSKQRQLGYFLGRIDKKGSDTLPLLKHPVERDAGNDEKQSQCTNSAKEKAVMNISLCEFLHNNIKQQTRIEEREYDNGAISKDLNNIYTRKIISTMDILLFSLYKITNNPLEITKLAYTTNIAKYLRRRKLVRHKKCMQSHSKYFMTCSNNNINKINKNTNKNCNSSGQGKDSIDFKKTQRDAKKNMSNIEIKCFSDENEHEKFVSKNETAMSKMKKHGVCKGELYTTISKCWKKCILSVLLDKGSKRTKEKPPITENKHKRKKRRKQTKHLTSREVKKEKDDKIGNSRLFAFLDEQNWTNCYHNNNDKVVGTAEEGIGMKNHETTNEKIIVNNITIPRLDLNLSLESNINLQMHKSNEQKTCSNKRKYHPRSFERFLKSIACSSCEFFRSSTDVDDARNEFYYGASETCLQIQEQQDSVRSKKSNAYPGSFHSASSEMDVLPEVAKEFQLVRTLNPLLIMKNQCSSILLRNKKNKDKILDTKRINPNKPEIMDRGCNSMALNVEKHVQTVRNKMIQCKVIKKNNANGEKSPRTNKNVVDKINVKKIENKYDKEIQTMPILTETDDKEVTAFPLMTSCGCQNLFRAETTQDFAVQVKIHRSQKKKKKMSECKDAKLMTCVPTCTCAAQCRNTNNAKKDIGTVVSTKMCDDLEMEEEIYSDRSTIETIVLDTDESRTDTTTCSYANVDHRNTFSNLRNYKIKRNHLSGSNDLIGRPNCHGRRLKDQVGKLTYQYGRPNEQVGRQNDKYGRLYDQVGRQNNHSGRQNDQFGRQNDNSGRQNNQSGRFKVRVLTKTNQSTLTDRTTLCDVSTATNDWWSPLVEKKVILKTDRLVEKRRKDCGQPRVRERRTFRNRGMSTGGKIVSFRSKTQFIPSRESGVVDILSPSRYLLESQKYYNELFSHMFASPRFPRVYPVANLQTNYNLERDRSQINNCHHKRRGRKIKRLEESYSPRKDIQPSLRMRRFDFRSPVPSRKSVKNKSTENKNN